MNELEIGAIQKLALEIIDLKEKVKILKHPQPYSKCEECPDCINGRDDFEPNWKCPKCREKCSKCEEKDKQFKSICNENFRLTEDRDLKDRESDRYIRLWQTTCDELNLREFQIKQASVQIDDLLSQLSEAKAEIERLKNDPS